MLEGKPEGAEFLIKMLGIYALLHCSVCTKDGALSIVSGKMIEAGDGDWVLEIWHSFEYLLLVVCMFILS